jgi:hypothetical protein
MPRLNARCRTALSLRFKSFATFAARVFARECLRTSASSFLVHLTRRFATLLAIFSILIFWTECVLHDPLRYQHPRQVECSCAVQLGLEQLFYEPVSPISVTQHFGGNKAVWMCRRGRKTITCDGLNPHQARSPVQGALVTLLSCRHHCNFGDFHAPIIRRSYLPDFSACYAALISAGVHLKRRYWCSAGCALS